MKESLIVLVVIFLAATLVVGQPLSTDSRPLNLDEMSAITGQSCSGAFGLSMSLAFASGLTAAALPVSAVFMTAAVAVGIGVAIAC